MITLSRLTSVAAIAAALLGTGCGGGDKNDYPAKSERAFLKSCEKSSKGKTSFCKCALEKVEEKLSFEEFKKEDTAIQAGRPPSRKLTDAISDCRS